MRAEELRSLGICAKSNQNCTGKTEGMKTPFVPNAFTEDKPAPEKVMFQVVAIANDGTMTRPFDAFCNPKEAQLAGIKYLQAHQAREVFVCTVHSVFRAEVTITKVL